MLPRRLTVTFDAHDPERLATFWAGVLGRRVVPEAGGAYLPGDATAPGLRFVAGRSGGAVPGRRLHPHLTSTDDADQRRIGATVLRLGGGHLDVGQRPEEDHIVLADPEGNALCVIGPGSIFLAGCGFLGEIACDGTRQVGLFWSAALGWPLVWDRDGETAIQSPAGGSKVAWGGPPVAAKHGTNPQRFGITVTGGDVAAEADRLVGLGASRLRCDQDGAVLLADPDGNEFSVAVA